MHMNYPLSPTTKLALEPVIDAQTMKIHPHRFASLAYLKNRMLRGDLPIWQGSPRRIGAEPHTSRRLRGAVRTKMAAGMEPHVFWSNMKRRRRRSDRHAG